MAVRFEKTNAPSQAANLGTAATKDVPASGDASSGQVVLGSDTRLTNARTPTSHTHPAADIVSGTLPDARIASAVAWNNAIPLIGRLLADFTTNSTSLVDATITGVGLLVPLQANSVYKFRCFVTGNGADANGLKFGVNFSAAGASINAGVMCDTSGTQVRSRRINALNTATGQAFMTSATDVHGVIEGIIVTGANAGNMTIQVAKVTSGTATINGNTFVEAVKIG
jgi:hypothetical protein